MADLFETAHESLPANDPEPESSESILPLSGNRVSIGRWTVARYVALTRWLVILTCAMAAAGLYVAVNPMIVLGIELAGFAGLGWLVAARGGGRTEAIAAGMIAGVGIGLMVSIVRLLLHREFAWLVNIVSETMLTAVFDGLLTIVFALIKQLLFRPT